MREIPIDAIRVGERHRRDLGDLEALAASIREVGLLQPIGVTADHELVFGQRRLLACRDHLGWTEIPARVVDVPSIVQGEYHENELRKAFTPSERVAIADAVREAIGDRRGERTDLRRARLLQEYQLRSGCGTCANRKSMHDGDGGFCLIHERLVYPDTLLGPECPGWEVAPWIPEEDLEAELEDIADDLDAEEAGEGRAAQLPEKIPEVRPGEETRDAAARLAGFGNNRTYRQAKEVVDKAAPNVIEAMDRGEVSISAAAKAIKAEPDPDKQAAWTSPEDIKRAARERLGEELRGKTPEQVMGEPQTLGALINAAATIGQVDGQPPARVARRLLEKAFPDVAAAAARASAATAGLDITPRDPGLDARAEFLSRVTAVLRRRDPWPFARMAAATPDHVVAMDIEDLGRVAALVKVYRDALVARSSTDS